MQDKIEKNHRQFNLTIRGDGPPCMLRWISCHIQIYNNLPHISYLNEPLYEHHGVAEHAARSGSYHSEGDLGGEEGGVRHDDVCDRAGEA